jgi:hypothetical protein
MNSGHPACLVSEFSTFLMINAQRGGHLGFTIPTNNQTIGRLDETYILVWMKSFSWFDYYFYVILIGWW